MKGMVWVDQSQVTTPIGGTVNVLIDHWWMVDAQGRVAIYKRYYPQCNLNPSVVDITMKAHPEAVNRVCIPLAYVPADLRGC